VLPSPGTDPQPTWAIVISLVLQVLALTINLWAVGRALAVSREPIGATRPVLVASSPPAAQ
jgi:hypothetical protein